MKIIHQADYKTNTWKGGITRELYIAPEGSSLSDRNFDVRISSAVIALTSSDFSDFSGYKRYILPVEGRLTLFRDERKYELSPLEPFLFSGDEAVRSENSKGAIDFNVIFRADQQVEVKVVERAHADNEQTRTLLFAIDEIVVDGQRVGKHDSVLIDGGYTLEGKAIVVTFL